jgi:hypothetical protein
MKDIRTEAIAEFCFKSAYGQPRSVYPANHWKIDIAVSCDLYWLVGKLFGLKCTNENLILRA